jgi:tRNA A-37 threonylcarbamoyl transferase component Bud32
MAEFPFKVFKKRAEQKEQVDLLNYRDFKKYLQTSENYIRIENREYRAELDKEFCAGAEPRDFIENIDTLMDDGQVLKKGDAIYVSHITWNNKNIVVKRYDHKGFIHSLRHTIKKTRARRGWLYAHFLGALGIATPRSPAYIEQRRGLLIWQSYLVTEYIGGQRLWHFLQDYDITEQQKMDGIRQVVNLLNRLWRSRITHGDLKHTNVLITQNGPVLIDLDGMMVHSWEQLYRNKQAKDIERFIRKTNISPVLNNYCQLLISSGKDSCNKLPEGFEKLRMDSWTICIRKDFPKNYIVNMITKGYSSSEDRGLFTRVPSSDYTNVFKYSFSLDGVDRSFYLKKYLCRSTLDFVKHLFRPSRARRAFNAALMLRRNGFDTPVVVGLFELRTGSFCTNNLLLTEEVESSKPMVQLLTEFFQKSGIDTFIHKRNLIKAFGRTIGRMHAEGIFHGDLRLGNVLVVREEQKWRFFFIDNERTKKFRRLPDRLRLKNLVQINMFWYGVTNIDRLRFFKAYLKDNPSIMKNRRDWVTKIFSKTKLRLKDKQEINTEK